VSLTDRDRKIAMIVVPLVMILGYWFLLLAPKRHEAASAQDNLTKVEQKRDQAVTAAKQLESAKTSFAADYTALVRLGKAIPTRVDMPSLIVQLDGAARGTGIRFKKVATGSASGATPAPAPSSGSGASGAQSGGAPTAPAPGTGNGSQPANAGGAPAQSTPGKQAEGAVAKTNGANAQNQGNANAAQQSGLGASDGATSTSSKKGLPVGGGPSAQSGAPGTSSSCAIGLVCVPLEFEFKGRFFRLADFFHRLKRFVRVANDRIEVRGRLLTIDTVKLSSDATSFPGIKAEVSATVYLAPPIEGATAGATPSGPAQTQPAASQSGSPSAPQSGSPSAPQGGSQSAPSTTPVSPAAPTATATP